jgi:hypothetical protein
MKTYKVTKTVQMHYMVEAASEADAIKAIDNADFIHVDTVAVFAVETYPQGAIINPYDPTLEERN